MNSPLEPADIFPECQPVLEVRDVQAALDWYVSRLGFEVDFTVGTPPTYACLGRSFSGQGAAAFVRFTNWCRDRTEPRTSGWLSIYVGAGIDDLYKEYKAGGVTFSRDIADQEYGMREFEIQDCDGHFLRFGCMIDAAQP